MHQTEHKAKRLARTLEFEERLPVRDGVTYWLRSVVVHAGADDAADLLLDRILSEMAPVRGDRVALVDRAERAIREEKEQNGGRGRCLRRRGGSRAGGLISMAGLGPQRL